MLSQYSSHHCRIILATIKYLGNCLCLLCTCPKEKVQDLGLKADDLQRGVIQVDSEERQMMVQKARDWIFKTGHAVTSDAIDEYLKLSVILICVMFLVPSGPVWSGLLALFPKDRDCNWSYFSYISLGPRPDCGSLMDRGLYRL